MTGGRSRTESKRRSKDTPNLEERNAGGFGVESSKRLVHGRVFDVDRVALRLPSGRRAIREVVRHPGAVAIVPLLPDGGVLLITQYRFAVDQTILEVPAGTIEPGETPLACARRELREEAGVSASRFRRIARFFPSPGFCDEVIHVFVATGLREDRAPCDEDECIEPVRLTAPAVRRALANGRIQDAKTMIGLLLIGFGGK
ncbi:MAG: NUDIX hydrolase [Planctomycetes bacterium]|nr:NUDIX hydrolase [Planctomycetota bacterium]MBI3847475.1 NUDIX hydrolase [Planctomycetota bacterium]